MGRHSIPEPGKSRPRPQRPDDTSGRSSGEWTGSHRVIDTRRRGLSFGVIAALVAVVVVIAGAIVWRFFGDALANRSRSAADRCLGGQAKVSVMADPAIADTIAGAAGRFNESAGPVGDMCPWVSVSRGDSDAVIDGLVGTWPADLGDKPALWIPASSASLARLQAAGGPATTGTPKSLAGSPVVLAVRPELKAALEQQTWATLPTLQNQPDSLDGLNLPGWGSLRLAMPRTGDSDASYLAAEAVAAASAPQDGPVTAGTGAVSALVDGQPQLDGNSLAEAFKGLLADGDAAAAPVHAVVTTEQRLFTRGASLPDARDSLAAWSPPGPAPVADFPAVLLSGGWINTEQASAASEFERFLRKPEQSAELAKVGFRVEGATPPSSAVVEFAPLTSVLSRGDDATRVAVANVFDAPAIGRGTSIMLDRSLNLAPVVSALNARIAAMPPTSEVGLTTFDGALGTTQVTLGPLSDQVDGESRGQRLTGALTGLGPGAGGVVSFTTLRNVYADALTHFRGGQTNSILVITSGPHTDQSLDGSGLQGLLRSSADPSRPVAVNVVNVGDDPDRATWEAVAQLTGGTYQNVPSSDSPEMVNAFTGLLG
jgi:hypothetical protein